MPSYDKDLINSRIIEVCDYYLPGEGKAEGYKRRKWDCPECGGDNFTANTEQEIAGCFSPSCDVPQTTKAIGIIAYFEGYEMRGRDFVECLKRGYEILGIPEPEDDEQGTSAGAKAKPGVRGVKRSRISKDDRQAGEASASKDGTDTASTQALAKENAGTVPPVNLPVTVQLSSGITMPAAGSETEGQPSKELLHRVYSAWMDMCPLVDSHREFWHGRGVTDETIAAGGFGSLSQDRCRYVLGALRERFGMEGLLTVPGFKRGPNSELHTNLFGEYTLIPYYDRDGYITTIEGRVPGQPQGKAPKYMAPVGAGSHLYVFPAFKPEHVMAFCEGLMGAVIAAQNGIAVASIKGYRCYRRSPAGKGKPYRVLAELMGVDFGGRAVYYIPDMDVKDSTRAEVEKAAPQAAKWLIEKQNGKPYLARLPEGSDDLDKWLLSLEEFERVTEFVKLTQTGITPREWKGESPAQPDTGKADATSGTEPTEDSDRHEGREDTDGLETNSGKLLQYSNKMKPESGTQTQQPDTGQDQENQTGQIGRQDLDDERYRIAAKQGQTSSPAGRQKIQPEPRRYKPIPKTNFGEFMVGLIYGGVAGIAFLMVMIFAAPELEAASFLARVPLPITVIVSLIVTTVVLRYMVRRQYVRRWYALRDHLAGKH